MAAGLLGEVLPDNHEAHRPTVSVGWGSILTYEQDV